LLYTYKAILAGRMWMQILKKSPQTGGRRPEQLPQILALPELRRNHGPQISQILLFQSGQSV
ncbi:MAG: hypothetical protein NTZ17_00890, partial [Phycisphaerae bacterium]|nr:hypothetical protein [Phycisphaerae bacterium]